MTDLKPKDLVKPAVDRLERCAHGEHFNKVYADPSGSGHFAPSPMVIDLRALLADRARMEKALGEITKEFGALQKVGAGDGQTFITNDTLAASTMRQIARQALGASQ